MANQKQIDNGFLMLLLTIVLSFTILIIIGLTNQRDKKVDDFENHSEIPKNNY